MAKTRMFRSGNSQAVRLPAEIPYADPGLELSISRCGDVITIFPASGGLADSVALLRRMPKPSAIEARDPIDMPDRGDV